MFLPVWWNTGCKVCPRDSLGFLSVRCDALFSILTLFCPSCWFSLRANSLFHWLFVNILFPFHWLQPWICLFPDVYCLGELFLLVTQPSGCVTKSRIWDFSRLWQYYELASENCLLCVPPVWVHCFHFHSALKRFNVLLDFCLHTLRSVVSYSVISFPLLLLCCCWLALILHGG